MLYAYEIDNSKNKNSPPFPENQKRLVYSEKILIEC